MDPDTVAMGLLFAGLPFRAVDALALPEASSLKTFPSDVWIAKEVVDADASQDAKSLFCLESAGFCWLLSVQVASTSFPFQVSA